MPIWFLAGALALWLLMLLGILAVAWWLSGIDSTLRRFRALICDQHAERQKGAEQERTKRETRYKQFALWLAQTASDVKKLRASTARLEELAVPEGQRKTIEMKAPPEHTTTADAPANLAAAKLDNTPEAGAHAVRSGGALPSEDDADAQLRSGPAAGHTLIGIDSSPVTPAA